MKWPFDTVMTSRALVVWSCAVAYPQAALAQEKPAVTSKWSAEIGVGAEYDSNVSIDELDSSSNESDSALTLDGEIKLEQWVNDATNATLIYNVSQSNFDTFDNLDRQTHLLGLDINTDLASSNLGLSLYYINARLDGEGFLTYYRASPYVSGFLAKKWFARVGYVYSDKTIEQREERNSQSHAGEADLYFFRRGLRSYFNLGYKFKDEDAVEDRFDYRANILKLRYIHRLDLAGKVLKLELAWRYEDRDYGSITPSIDMKRQDERNRWKVDLEYPLSENSAVQLYAGYADYDSNSPRSNYTQETVGTRLYYRW